VDQADGRDKPADADPGPTARAVRRVTPQIRRVERKVRREANRLAGLSYLELPPREAVRIVYNVLLRREPDEPAWTDQANAMAAGDLSHADLVDQVRCSSEYRTQVPILPGGLHASLHASRSEFIIGLPSARRIVDLGGGSTRDARGALVALGCPYDFDELVVVDLPPDDRHPLCQSERFSTSRSGSGPTRPIGARPRRVPVDGRPLLRR
jgi:hypothetical protein